MNSIPLSNLSLAHLRSPMTKAETKSLLDNLFYEQAIIPPGEGKNRLNNSNFLKEIIYLNNPKKTVRVLIYLDKIKNDSKLSSADDFLYNQSINHLAEEISLVNKVSFESIRNEILTGIKR